MKTGILCTETHKLLANKGFLRGEGILNLKYLSVDVADWWILAQNDPVISATGEMPAFDGKGVLNVSTVHHYIY